MPLDITFSASHSEFRSNHLLGFLSLGSSRSLDSASYRSGNRLSSISTISLGPTNGNGKVFYIFYIYISWVVGASTEPLSRGIALNGKGSQICGILFSSEKRSSVTDYGSWVSNLLSSLSFLFPLPCRPSLEDKELKKNAGTMPLLQSQRFRSSSINSQIPSLSRAIIFPRDGFYDDRQGRPIIICICYRYIIIIFIKPDPDK